MVKWRNRHSPPQTAEPQHEKQAVREVPPHLRTRLSRHKNLVNLARGELPAAGQLTQVCEDASFSRTVTEGQFFVTRSAIELTGQGAISSRREHTHPREDPKFQKEQLGATPGLEQFGKYCCEYAEIA